MIYFHEILKLSLKMLNMYDLCDYTHIIGIKNVKM